MKTTYTAAYEQFRERITALRREAELSQDEVAQRLGKPQSFISKIESGERRLDLVEYVHLARAIGFEPAHLLHELDNNLDAPVRQPSKPTPATRTDKRLAKAPSPKKR